MISWRKKTLAISKFLLLPAVFLFFFSCALIKQSDPSPPGPLPVPNLQKAEAELTEAAIQLLAISQTLSPGEYARQRKIFEAALNEYLQLSGFRNVINLPVKREGITFVLPIQVIEVANLATEVPGADTSRVIGTRLDLSFRGEIIDLALYPGSRGLPYRLMALLPDSLVSFNWPVEDDPAVSVQHFTLKDLHAVRSPYPTGLLAFRKLDSDELIDVVVLSSHLRRGMKLLAFGKQPELSIADSSAAANGGETWTTAPGDNHFSSGYAGSPDVYSQRILSNGQSVMLDREGHLTLVADNKLDIIWKSDRPAGDRLFVLKPDLLAVCYPGQRSFQAYQLDNRKLRYLGQSPEFEGPVQAVLYAALPQVSGYLVAVRLARPGQLPVSILRFVHEDDFRWKPQDFPPAITAARPDGDFTLRQEKVQEAYRGNSPLAFPPVAIQNVYETLYRCSPDGIARPFLARDARAENGYRTWEIRLRRDVRFSDGSLLSSADVLEGWKHFWRLPPAGEPEVKWLFSSIRGASDFLEDNRKQIDGISLPDSFSLRIELTEPRPFFVEQLTHAVFSVAKAAGVPLGTGPFAVEKIRNSSQQTQIACLRNDYYHQGAPPLKHLNLNFYQDNITAIDVAAPPEGALVRLGKDIGFFRKLPQMTARPMPASPVYFLAFNPDYGPLGNRELRQEIAARVIQRNEIADIVTEGEARVAATFFNDQAVSVPVGRKRPLPPQRPLRIAYPAGDPVARQIAERLAARLNQSKLTAQSPKGLSPADFQLLRGSGKYDILVDRFEAPFMLPVYNWVTLLKRGYAVDRSLPVMLDKALQSVIPDSAPEAVERMLIEDAVLMPLIRIQPYAMLPEQLRGTGLIGTDRIDFSRSWQPQETPETP